MVSSKVDISAGNPNHYIYMDLQKLLEIVNSKEDWNSRDFDVLDHIYRSRVAVELSVSNVNFKENLREMYEHLRRVAAILSRHSQHFSVRWRAMADLLATRLAGLESQDPVAIRKHKWVEEILGLLEYDRLIMEEIAQRLNINNIAQLEMILSMMRSNELVEAHKVSGTLFYMLGRNA
ncbi:hypothetical protein KJ885_00230 [Patescibacteria group bacterium]|nr:hypothetical protein [Patescibacteria group bacterium]